MDKDTIAKLGIIGVAALGVGGWLAYTGYNNLKSEAEKLQRKDEIEIGVKFTQRLRNADCAINFSPVKEYKLRDSKHYPDSPRMALAALASNNYHRGFYTTGNESDLKDCSSAVEKRIEIEKEMGEYGSQARWHIGAPPVYGLPKSLLGKDVFILSKIDTSSKVDIVSLGTNGSYEEEDCYKIERYGWDVVITGDIDYCVTNNVKNRNCRETFGQLVVKIKPDNLEQTCAQIEGERNRAWDSLPSISSYMWQAILGN